MGDEASLGVGASTTLAWSYYTAPTRHEPVGNLTIGVRPESKWWRWITPYRPVITAGPYTNASMRETLGGWQRFSQGNGLSVRTRFEPRMSIMSGMRGLGGALGGSFLIDGVIQGILDLPKCLTGYQRLHNITVSGLTGVLAGIGGALAFTGIMAVGTVFGAPVLAVSAIAIGISAVVAFGISNFSSLSAWRKELLYP